MASEPLTPNHLIGGLFGWWGLIRALMRREIRARFAGGPLGYLWVFLTPLAWIGALVVSFEHLGRSPAIGADVPSFVATGMLPYVVFRQTITAMSRAAAGARSLMHLAPMTMGDILIAAALLELLNALVIFAVIFLLIAIAYGPVWPADPLTVMLAVGQAALLGAAFGRLAAALGRISDVFARLIPIALRPLFWISGIFFIAAELPGPIAAILWWNPLLHVVEMLRGGFFAGFSPSIADPGYVLGASAFLAALALIAEAWQRRREAVTIPGGWPA